MTADALASARAATTPAGALSEYLRQAAWMDDVGRTAPGFRVVDTVDLDGPPGRRGVALVAPENHPQRWYAVAIDESGRLYDGCAVLDGLVADGLRRQRTVRTRQGGLVCFQGDAPSFDGPEPFEPGWSSNALSRLRLGGAPHVHKRYRVVSADTHEPAVLRAARGSGCLPEYTGDYAYVSPDGGRYPLGVVYRYVDGQPLEGLLRANVRSLWTVLAAGGEVAGHVQELAPVLRETGALIRRLHHTLAARLVPGVDLDVPRCLARAQDLLAVALADLHADARHPEAVRRAIADGLTRAVSRASAALRAAAPPPGAGGIGHGDLHLSHLLCQPAGDGSWAVRAIDVSPAAIHPDEPGFADQSPWQDLVAVQRGLEAFAAHEASVEVARVHGVERREVIRRAVHDAGRAASPGPRTEAGCSARPMRGAGRCCAWSWTATAATRANELVTRCGACSTWAGCCTSCTTTTRTGACTRPPSTSATRPEWGADRHVHSCRD
jgi:hypothetical protein